MSKEIKQLKKNNEFVNKSLLEKKAKLSKTNKECQQMLKEERYDN